MNILVSKEQKRLLESKYTPAVSIILPFEPKMSLQHELDFMIRLAMRKVEKELLGEYPTDKATAVIKKLHDIVRNLNYNTHKKSIGIFVSPLSAKVIYLDFVAEEKIVVDESFEIRDLIHSKKQQKQYLVLVLGRSSSKMYLGNCSNYVLIKSNLADPVLACQSEFPGKTGHFSDPKQEKEILAEKFLHHMDEGLAMVLLAYPLPVFVLGSKRTLGHFSKITRNKKAIISYIHGNYEESTGTALSSILQPHVSDWSRVRQQNMMQQIERAADENKLAFGIQAVWREAVHKNARLLMVEKDFSYSAHLGTGKDYIYKKEDEGKYPFYIKDAVDDIMEKILESGGDIEFVENGALDHLEHIALIKKLG